MKIYQKIINIFCVVLIIIMFFSVFSAKQQEFNIENYFSQIGIILAALAIIVIEEKQKFVWLKNRQYLYEYKHFVDRYQQIQELLNVTKKEKCVVNVFGMSGIGITDSLKFVTDLINRKVPLKKRMQYWKSIHAIILSKQIAWYFNISGITNIQDFANLVYQNMFSTRKAENITIPELLLAINKKARYKKLIISFDEIYNKEQLSLIEDFILQYYQFRPQDIFFIGSHKKSLSYHLTYKHLEILKFDKTELLILAKTYKINLKNNEDIQLYELSEGIPLFAYLLLRYYDEKKGLCTEGLLDYMRDEILTALTLREREVIVRIALLSLANLSIDKNVLELSVYNFKYNELNSLIEKGLIQKDSNTNNITISKMIQEQVILLFNDKDFSRELYIYFKKLEMHPKAILFLLLGNIKEEDTEYFENIVSEWIYNNDVLSMYVALMPSIHFEININRNDQTIYFTYAYACITMLLACGEYPYAKNFINKLIVDGKYIKRADDIPLDDRNFDFYFLWADAEHLLNNYSKAISLLEPLISVSLLASDYKRLCKTYWMKAHCLRHQWKFPNKSLSLYKECEKISIKNNQTEYLIRSLHGQILISFILMDKSFDYNEAFNRLNKIYDETQNIWNNYKYNTYKYKSIYWRLNNDKSKAFEFLNLSLEGYLSIKRRNVYDVYFEFGEYYRYFNKLKEARKSYKMCFEFSKGNKDYNLQSLSELGIILTYLPLNEQHDLNNTLDHIRMISTNALAKELHLNYQYAKIIEDKIKKNETFEKKLLLFNP